MLTRACVVRGRYDDDGSGSIDREELGGLIQAMGLEGLLVSTVPVPPEAELQAAFDNLGLDRGRVTEDDLSRLLSAAGSEWGGAELSEAFAGLDRNQAGAIAYSEFHELWQKKWNASHADQKKSAADQTHAQTEKLVKLNDDVHRFTNHSQDHTHHIPGIAYHPDRYVDKDDEFRGQVATIFEEIDRNRDENISYMEFLAWWKRKYKALGKEFDGENLSESRTQFAAYDTNENGTIDVDELGGLLRALALEDLIGSDTKTADAASAKPGTGRKWQKPEAEKIVVQAGALRETPKGKSSANKAVSSVTQHIFKRSKLVPIHENPEVLMVLERLMDSEPLDDANIVTLVTVVSSQSRSTVEAVDYLMEALREDRSQGDDQLHINNFDEFCSIAVSKGCTREEVEAVRKLLPSKVPNPSDIIDVGYVLAKILGVPTAVLDNIDDEDYYAAAQKARELAERQANDADAQKDLTGTIELDCDPKALDFETLEGQAGVKQLAAGIAQQLGVDPEHIEISEVSVVDGKTRFNFELHELANAELEEALQILGSKEVSHALAAKINLAGKSFGLREQDLAVLHTGTRNAMSMVHVDNEKVDIVEGWMEVRYLEDNGVSLSDWQSVYCSLEQNFLVFLSSAGGNIENGAKKSWNIFKREKLPRPVPLRGAICEETESMIQITSNSGQHHLRAETAAETEMWGDDLKHSIELATAAEPGSQRAGSNTDTKKFFNPLMEDALDAAADGRLVRARGCAHDVCARATSVACTHVAHHQFECCDPHDLRTIDGCRWFVLPAGYR